MVTAWSLSGTGTAPALFPDLPPGRLLGKRFIRQHRITGAEQMVPERIVHHLAWKDIRDLEGLNGLEYPLTESRPLWIGGLATSNPKSHRPSPSNIDATRCNAGTLRRTVPAYSSIKGLMSSRSPLKDTKHIPSRKHSAHVSTRFLT